MGAEEDDEEKINQEEAQRLKALAEAKYESSNVKSALKYVKRALRLCPDNDGLSSMAAAFEILQAASGPSSAIPDWYKVLRVEPFCHFNAIKKQYRKLALTLHPDKNPYPGSEEAFKLVNEGFRVLSDKIRRKEYDMKLRIRIQDERTRERDGLVPGDTFWTACSTCKLLHQFERKYLGHNLVCPSCRKSFEAFEIGSERSKTKNEKTRRGGSVFEPPKMGGIESDDGDDGRVKIADLKKRKIGSDDMNKEVGGGEWSGGRLRSCGLRKRMSSVGVIMERSRLARVKTDDETMTLAELQSRVKRKANKQKEKMKEKEKEKMKEKEKEKEKEKDKEKEREKLKVIKEKRDSKVEKRSASKRSKDSGSESSEVLEQSLSLALQKGPRDRDSAVMAVEDSDFYDFDKDRVERSFKKGQVWAVYDDDDGMPRHYGLIDEVVSVNPFEAKISWLDHQKEGLVGFETTRLHVSCGRFRVSRKTSVSSVNIFSHLVDCERAAKEAYRIYPKKGSVWALYKDSSGESKRCYDIVVFLTTYSEMQGLSMAYLEKVDGFKTIFRRREIGSRAVRWLEKDDVGLFSHQIPARKLTGDEAPELSKDCWELDPASLPSDLLRIGYEG